MNPDCAIPGCDGCKVSVIESVDDDGNVYDTRELQSCYYPMVNERIKEIHCNTCGVVYTQEQL